MKYTLLVIFLAMVGCQSVPMYPEVSYNQRELHPQKGTSCLPQVEFEKQVSYSNRPNLCQ